jgi:hypothetical protein
MVYTSRKSYNGPSRNCHYTLGLCGRSSNRRWKRGKIHKRGRLLVTYADKGAYCNNAGKVCGAASKVGKF